MDDHGEDETVIELSFAGDGLDRVVNGANFWPVVVSDAKLSAGVEHDGFVVVEPARVGQRWGQIFRGIPYMSTKETH